jgi:hypothetical protein
MLLVLDQSSDSPMARVHETQFLLIDIFGWGSMIVLTAGVIFLIKKKILNDKFAYVFLATYCFLCRELMRYYQGW